MTSHCVHRLPRHQPGPLRYTITFALGAVLLLPLPASAQMLGQAMSQAAGPFAGQIAPNGSQMAPLYGSQAGATPHLLQGTGILSFSGSSTSVAQTSPSGANTMAQGATGSDMQSQPKSGDRIDVPDADVSSPFWEMLIGSCAGGAFIGGFSAATATVPVGVVVATGPVLASAMAVGCGLGVATAAVSYGAVFGWQKITR